MNTTIEFAQQQDQQDVLSDYRRRFLIDDSDVIYLDGNSLGRPPLAALSLAEDMVKYQWGDRLIRSWNENWMGLSKRIGDKIGQVIGAKPNEVVIADSTSVNLFKLFIGALKHNSPRKKIITDEQNFPSDLYILDAAAELSGGGFEIITLPLDDDFSVSMKALDEAIDGDTALVTLSHIMYKSSFMYDIAGITKLAHERGALVLWDLSHSVGAVPLHCERDQVDLAVGSTYKFLNGGPGAPAFLYVAEDLQTEIENPIAGWFGHKAQFLFDGQYEPASDINRFLTGTPSIFSQAMIEPGVDLTIEAGIELIREKSIRQAEYMIGLWEAKLKPLGFALNTPEDHSQRGSHVSFGHPAGYRIEQAIRAEKNVVSDFRMPDNMRFGITPLYTTYEELYFAVQALVEVFESGSYKNYSTEIHGVT